METIVILIFVSVECLPEAVETETKAVNGITVLPSRCCVGKDVKMAYVSGYTVKPTLS